MTEIREGALPGDSPLNELIEESRREYEQAQKELK